MFVSPHAVEHRTMDIIQEKKWTNEENIFSRLPGSVFRLCISARLCDEHGDDDGPHDRFSELLSLCSDIECIICEHVSDEHKVSVTTQIDDVERYIQ